MMMFHWWSIVRIDDAPLIWWWCSIDDPLIRWCWSNLLDGGILSFENIVEMSLLEGLTLPRLISTRIVNLFKMSMMLKWMYLNVIVDASTRWDSCFHLFIFEHLHSIIVHVLPEIWRRCCCSYSEIFFFFWKTLMTFLHPKKHSF